MRKIAIALVLAMSVLPVCGQTLRDALVQAGIPTGKFPPAELAKNVNATSGNDGAHTYLAYVTVDANNILTSDVGLIRYDSATSAVLLRNLNPDEMENCCGSPLEIEFTHSYILVSFHDNPSADTVVAARKDDLKYRMTLYGLEFHEIAPDQLVYVENDVHFSFAQPVRIAYADLVSAQQQELYPSKNDALLAEFLAFHQRHMPPAASCEAINYPCDAGLLDEGVDFLKLAPDEIQFRLSRGGGPTIVGKSVPIPVEVTLYIYRRTNGRWFYCEQDQLPVRLINSDEDTPAVSHSDVPSCHPKVPVLPDDPGPFSPRQEKR